jgi:hypothetical protein
MEWTIEMGVQNRHDEHNVTKKRRQSPRVCHNAAVLRWQLFNIYEWNKLLPNRTWAVANDFHFGKRRGRQNRLEQPEDPRHD